MNLSTQDNQYSANDAIQLGRLYEIDCGEHDNHEDDSHDHASGGCDPHVWMNPTNAMYWVMRIRDTLIELDPANAESYTVNADRYLEELVGLIDDFIVPLVETLPEDKRILIASHDSLGYLTATYKFKTIGTIIQSGSTLAEPSVQDIVRIIDLIGAESVPAIFSETTVNDKLAQTIANETGAQLVVLYSGSLSDENGSASTYIEYIRTNYTAIVDALGGDS
jgi:ABC-type Zn uptake system ZnuABC Zn-binding protein ZnuA